MKLRQPLATVVAGCLCLVSLAASAKPAADAGVPTVVLMDRDLENLHYLPPVKKNTYVSARDVYVPPANTYADALGGALGAAIGSSIANEMAAIAAQRRADAALDDLILPLGENGLRPLLRQAMEEALATQGMDLHALVSAGQAAPSAKMFPRIAASRNAEKFMVLRNGALSKGYVDLPLAMHDSMRQLRLALAIDVLEGDHEKQRRVATRDVAIYTDVMDFAEDEAPLAALGADEQARLRRELGQALTIATGLVLADHKLPKVGKDDAVGALSSIGLTEFQGVLVEEKDGRALIWTRGDTLVSIPADEVLTGEALVAAREDEALRRNPPADTPETDDGMAEVASAEDPSGTEPGETAPAPISAEEAQEPAAPENGPASADGTN
jgi:hypothetical protein